MEPASGVEREVVVHLDRTLGLEVRLQAGSGTTVGALKRQLAQGDPTGQTDPAAFRLTLLPPSSRVLGDAEAVPDGSDGQPVELELCTQAPDHSSEAGSESCDSASDFDDGCRSEVGAESSCLEDDAIPGGQLEAGARRPDFTILSRSSLVESQLKQITAAADLLQVTQAEGFFLLRDHRWDVSRLQDAWFSNEAAVRERCGLCPASSSSAPPVATITCPICFEPPVTELVAIGCGHSFCATCWQGYLHSMVDDGKACVQARCPQHKCRQAVPLDFFGRFCDEQRSKQHEEWMLQAYVDDNPAVKWCTNPAGCSLASECPRGGLCEIQCKCGFIWCWACGEEAHRPADCQAVSMWNIKNGKESENISWIKANTKKCPKCRKPIEKNQGCNHMRCTQSGGCGHEFCWLCLGDWSQHGQATGGYYKCNLFEQRAQEGKPLQDAGDQKIKDELDKYMFYFERFTNHDRGMKLTVQEEQAMEGKMTILQDVHKFQVMELQFLLEALRQVRVCRGVLKWTYVYGFYLEGQGPEKNLFEHLQKDLEEKTDSLHEMLETELDAFTSAKSSCSMDVDARTKFADFIARVTNFTKVTQQFMSKILADLGVGESLVSAGHF